MGVAYGYGGLISVPPAAIRGHGAPPASFKAQLGQLYFDADTSPPTLYIYNGVSWDEGGDAEATTSTFGNVQLATLAELQGGTAPAGAYVPTANDVATVIAGVVVGAVPAANEGQAGIAYIATQAEVDAGTDDSKIVTPLKLTNFIGAGTEIGSFTDLTATGTVSFTGATGAYTITSATASTVNTTGAGIDLTLDSASGRLVLTGGEAAADAVRIQADNAGGGIDIDAGTLGVALDTTGAFSIDSAATSNVTVTGAGADLNLGSVLGSVLVSSTENAALAIRLHANGGTSETIQLHSDQGTGVGSVNLLSDVGGLTLRSTGLASNDAINLEAAAGGIDMDAALQINIATSQSAADSIVISSSAGGIDILATGAAAGEDIDILATGSSVNISSTENAALAITLNTNGGTSETIRVRNQQGTGAASIELNSTAGGLTLAGGLGTADAVNITASTAGGGIDIDSSTGGFDLLTTGAISLDASLASNLTVTGAGADLTLSSVGGSVLAESTENAALAIRLHANGGTSETIQIHSDQGTGVASIDILSDVGGITLTATGLANADAINLNAAAGGVDIDGALQVNIASSQAAASAIVISASNAAGGVDITTGGGSVDISSAGLATVVAGTDTEASPSATAVINTNVGRATFTGFTTASAAAQVFTITNSIVTTASCVIVTACNEGANDAQMTVTRVVRAAGSLAVTCTNNGAAALNGDVAINFWVLTA